MSVELNVFIALSAVMFLEFAIWGAWAPVLAARLLGPLNLTGKQTGWVYGALPLASIFAPLVAGQIADEWVSTEYLLAAAHLLGAILLFVVVRQTRFVPLFITMLLYSCCYAATLPLVNKLLFAHVSDVYTQSLVFIWAPVSWALAGYTLTGWRQIKGEGDGSDCLIMAGILSAVMAVVCLFAPHTPALGKGGMPILEAMGLLGDPDFLVFLLVSLVVAGLMQFYFMGTAQFMMDRGISGKYVPAAMAIAQAAQAVATWFLMVLLITTIGFQWTLVAGATAWLLMYLVYIAMAPRPVLIASQALHGIAYVLFIIVGQIFANEFAPASIRGSVQALVFAATTGVGLFLFTQMAGIVMDKFSVEGKFQWRKIWSVPAVLMLLGVVVLATAVNGVVGIPAIVKQIDADNSAEITKAEVDKIPDGGLKSGAFAFSRQELLDLFQENSSNAEPIAADKFSELLASLSAEKAKETEQEKEAPAG